MALRAVGNRACLPRRLLQSRSFSQTPRRTQYSNTIKNLQIGQHTRVIFQGFTGRVATQNAKESLEYGTNIVGGVTPGKDGEHLGRPVLPTVRAAKELLKPDATAIYVAAQHAAGAIEEAIEAEIPLIVAVAEHIPLHDILRITAMLNTQSKCRLVGANAPGIISPLGHCRIGFQPLPTFSPGHIGIVAKSGTLSYETVASITRAGLGQSLCIGMGGDIVAGTSLVDGLIAFETDDRTEGIVIVGEAGGTAELEAADWIKDYHKRVSNPKPIAALVGGRAAPSGRIMGHAGAWAGPGELSAEEKYKILGDAGATMVDHPEKFGGVLKSLLSQAGKDVNKIQQSAAQNQRRSMHTLRRTRLSILTPPRDNVQQSQKRSLHLSGQNAIDILKPAIGNVEITSEKAQGDTFHLSISVDRSIRSPCIIASPSTDAASIYKRALRIPYTYNEGPSKENITNAIGHLQLDAAPPSAHAQVASLISSLASLYKSKDCITIATTLSITSSGSLCISQPQLQIDDSAFKSGNRHADLFALRDVAAEDPTDVEAEKSGIVFVKLHAGDSSANIGTLVNGAGLAMNTVDALALAPHYGKAANFLDTGGKATSQTVKTSFDLILRDERVKVIFVNIFGGLTDGGMIADGVILAFKEVDMRGIPVVVRIRGTNEAVGQKKIAESGLQLEAFDGFEEAAARVVAIAREKSRT